LIGPAWILGNGPTLPVAGLSALGGRFTVGVNRILSTGFVPTAVVWVDSDIARECKRDIEASGALLIGPSSHNVAGVLPVDIVAGRHSWASPAMPWQLHCNGNTGVAAARWAASLGCDPVYLCGMGAAYVDGKTNFYGVNPHHGNSALTAIRDELRRLLSSDAGHYMQINTPEDLAYSVARHIAQDMVAVRADVERAVRAR
jgi:hypothetical protein